MIDSDPTESAGTVASGNAFAAVWRNPYVRVLVFALLIYLAYRFVGRVGNVLTLAVISYIIAYLANPLLRWLERRYGGVGK